MLLMFEVQYTDEYGTTSSIDKVYEEEGYTAEDYIADCDENSTEEWCEMLHKGTVKLVSEMESDYEYSTTYHIDKYSFNSIYDACWWLAKQICEDLTDEQASKIADGLCDNYNDSKYYSPSHNMTEWAEASETLDAFDELYKEVA